MAYVHRRVKAGRTIEHRKMPKKLALYAKEHFDVEFDEYEIQNITIQLICKRATKGLNFYL